MKHLIVYAHPNPKSFCGTISQHLKSVSKKEGNSVVLRDLYKLNFNPVLGAKDFETIKAGKTPSDIRAEQRAVAAADFITLIFPLWWTGYPAILKGWIDRVLQNGFAFKHSPQAGITPLLTNKRVQLIITMGASVTEYEKNGLMDAMARTMGDNVWSFCGCEDAGLIALGEIPGASPGERSRILKELEVTLRDSLKVPTVTKKPKRKLGSKKNKK